VCQSVCLSVRISLTRDLQFSLNFLYMLPIAMAVAWHFSGGVAICYASGFEDDIMFSQNDDVYHRYKKRFYVFYSCHVFYVF